MVNKNKQLEEVKSIQEPQMSDFGLSESDLEFLKNYPDTVGKYLRSKHKYTWISRVIWAVFLICTICLILVGANESWWGWWGVALFVLFLVWINIDFGTPYIPKDDIGKEIAERKEGNKLTPDDIRYWGILEKQNNFTKAFEEYQQEVSKHETPIALEYTEEIKDFFYKSIYRKRINSSEGEEKLEQFRGLLADYKDFRNTAKSDYSHRSEWDYLGWIDQYLEDRSRRALSSTQSVSSLSKTGDGVGEEQDVPVEGDGGELVGGLAEQELSEPEVDGSETLKIQHSFVGKHVDFEQLNSVKIKLGSSGQEAVVRHEKVLLSSAGKDDLAERVTDVSIAQGDGTGYDILSFTEDGEEKYIEVKTTKKGAGSSFILTENEIVFMKQNPDNTYLYRIVNWDDKTKAGDLFVLAGYEQITKYFTVEPSQYKIKPKG